ncbi:MAG TPA: FAD-binding oxidoreductase [Candidatus Acidoferrales bacterium]|jgi:glycine/D-amino acid oxidase-like deaminating enzyme|nr:FAD-binding oxidoreductase [Candidatus Acidoferrales bacterium]
MSVPESSPHNWGKPPWVIHFYPPEQPLPREADFIIVGAGFTGLAAAAWLRLLDSTKSVVVLEAGRIGHGASGRTGGMALAETAAGNLPGLGDVLAGIEKIFARLEVGCDLALPGAFEISRKDGREDSPIRWQDSGTLRVVNEVPGGTLDPGKLVSGLARAAHQRGAVILENHRVTDIAWGERPVLSVARESAKDAAKITARKILLATNGVSLELSGLSQGHSKLTLATLTAPLGAEQLQSLGLAMNKPFYTENSFPYLWGRTRPDRSIVWGAGLVDPPASGNLEEVRVDSGQPAEMFAKFEKRVRGLHPATAHVEFTHHWGGPILFRDNWEPVFDWHPKNRNALVTGAFAGHGVALSNYLGTWAAEILLGRRSLPSWGKL